MTTIKVKVDRYLYPVTIIPEGERLFLQFRYNEKLKDEIKCMQGARWHPDRKLWSVVASKRNFFQLNHLAGNNPYAIYDQPLINFVPRRKKLDGSFWAMEHQIEMAAHALTRKQCEFACEMGTGKTLAMIEAMDQSGCVECFWVGPKSALYSVKLEFQRWQCCDHCGLLKPDHKNADHPFTIGKCLNPRFYTYEALRKLIEEWPKGKVPPQMVVFDESSRCKNPTAQRSQAALNLANEIRDYWKENAYVVLMSGSPAPKSPLDWHMQCEIACPGFLKEGDIHKFQKRLAIIEERQSITGGVYPHLVTWRDSEKKCENCGQEEVHRNHDLACGGHSFRACTDEVSKLYRRMNGLVLVKFKKDCFSGDTEVLTKIGIFTFQELSKIGRAELYVNTPNGMQWIDCQIKSFGQQEVFPITFGDGNVVYTTQRHQWLVRKDGRKIHKNPFKIKTTLELNKGKDELPLASVPIPEIDWEAYAHGFIFGDGHVATSEATGRKSCRVALFGYDNDLFGLLSKFGISGFMERKGWDFGLNVINNLPKTWKELPKNPTRSYAFGFVLGLIAADGWPNKNSNFYIGQACKFSLSKIRRLALWSGLRCGPIKLFRELSPFDGNYKPLFIFAIQTYNLSKDHFVREDHKKAFKRRGRFLSTTVSKVKYTERKIEEVFCAIVPEYHNFTLANNVITRNCLNLPDKRYEIIECQPTPEMLRAASIINAKSPSAIQALTLLRELSDGFQYKEEEVGVSKCPICNGSKVIEETVDLNDPDNPLDDQSIQTGYRVLYDDSGTPTGQGAKLNLGKRQIACPTCNGTGEVVAYNRVAKEVTSPKDDALLELIDRHEECGRLVIFAGFTGSIDRCVGLVRRSGWDYIRVDGRGWTSSIPGSPVELLEKFQYDKTVEKICFIAHPASGGMGLNLTASPSEIYYSNDFNAESRIQSEDRIHRPGMDLNKGATIYDLICLPTDLLVLHNLKRKRRLQDLTLGQMGEEIKALKFTDIRNF